MPRHLLCLAIAGLCFASAASAQERVRPRVNVGEPSFSDLAAQPPSQSPELWLYSQQMRRYDDPAQAVRRNAEYKAAQRMARISSLHWYGMSNARPQASGVPSMAVYSPAWIGNGMNPYEWVGGGYPYAPYYTY